MTSLRILPLSILIVLFAVGCKSPRSNSETSNGAVAANTKVTKENLKARLAGNKVKFMGDDFGKIEVVEISRLTLKLLNPGIPPKVDLNGQVYEFSELLTKLREEFERRHEKSVTLTATEPDIAFYNKAGISVEDFERLIRALDQEVDEFIVDFAERNMPDREKPRSGPSPGIRPIGPSDFPSPPPLKKLTP